MRENLAKLSAYLKGKLKTEFNMEDYSDHCNSDNCGTVGCAAGHGPHAGIAKFHYEPWSQYIDRVFTREYNAQKWLFSSYWKFTDNTARGAAARIDWYLKRGVPVDAASQMNGNKELCYARTD